MIKNFKELATSTLRRDALLILEEGLKAADPERAVFSATKLVNGKVCFYDLCLDMGSFDKIHVLGFGKASYKMLLGIIKVLKDRIHGGVVITHNPEWVGKLNNVRVVRGDHPIPGINTFRATEELLNYVRSNVGNNDLVIVLISGGGSALFELPYKPITLDDLSKLNELLLKSGADINEINTVRKHVSMVKGGRLAKMLYPALTVSLIISDVVGDPLDVIASGPTAPDRTTFNDAVKVLKRRRLWNVVPSSVREVINAGLRGIIDETPKPGDKIFNKVHNFIVASNILSLKAMARKAQELGYNPLILTSLMEGEAREVGRFLASIARHIVKYGFLVSRPLALLLGGETTVTVKGIGGRNQELVLSFAIHIAGLENVVLASIGSDGKDGISDAAGGIADGSTYYESLRKGLDPMDYLERNDSNTLLRQVRGAIYTGITGTNVNDLTVMLIR